MTPRVLPIEKTLPVALPLPEGVTREPGFRDDGVYLPSETGFLVGPTVVGEYLLVDVRVAKDVPPESSLFGVCQSMVERGACGVIDGTLVVDILEASREGRLVLLDFANWPKPGGPRQGE